MLLEQPRLGSVLRRCGHLHLDFRHLNLDERKLAEPFRSLFDRLGGIAGRAQIHLSDFGHLGPIGIIRPLGISRLSLYHFSEISRAEDLLPRTKSILEAPF